MNHKIKLFLFLFSISLTGGSFAQEGNFQINNILFKDGFNFPILNSTGNNLQAEKINQFIQIKELGIINGFYKSDITEDFDIAALVQLKGYLEKTYTIENNSTKVFSLKFNEGACDANCFYWKVYYNFNPGNGDLMQLHDLFTPQGFVEFLNISSNARFTVVQRELKKLENADGESYEYYNTDLFKQNLDDYLIDATGIYFDDENRLPKYIKSELADKGMDLSSHVDLKDIKNLLNDYGKSVFGLINEPVSKYRASALPLLYEGIIGDQEIILLLDSANGDASGDFVYKTMGEAVALDGKIRNNTIALREMSAEENVTAYIEARMVGDQITGTWTNRNKTVKLLINVTRK